MKAKELKQKYLDFFKSKKHTVIPSAPLIPEHDPSVLFTTAGMHPLVPFLLGQPHPLGKRLTNVQKCMRTQDIDEVGDATHTTFFEMLGNWSFGDYFKKEAIEWSFEFLTSKKWLHLPLDRLAVSCFQGDKNAPKDDESATIWKKLGIPTARIAFLPKEDNWWGPAGESGPCGPDTEMFYWVSDAKPPAKFDPKDKNWVEIWNDVFMEYKKDKRVILVDGMYCLYDEKFNLNDELLNMLNKEINSHNILVVNKFKEKGYHLVKDTNWKAFSLEEMGIKKNNPKYFETLLKEFGLLPEEVIYFDHDKENVKTANKLGILSQHYTDVLTIKKLIEDNLYCFIPLAQKNVDTGLGVERVTMVLQGKKTVFDTELFQPIFAAISQLGNLQPTTKNILSFRIIADHMRAATFILSDERSVTPGNVDQGYILRRYIRRTIRHGKKLGLPDGFCTQIASVIIKMYKDEYHLLAEKKAFILDELQKEEAKFEQTLEKGLKEFASMAGQQKISGKDAFLLFQSYGFPLEITEELADEKGIAVDVEGYLAEYEKHQQLSRLGAEKKFKGGLSEESPQTIRYHTATHILNEALRKVISLEIKQRGSNITPERLRFDFSFDRKLTVDEVKKVEQEVNQVITAALPVERKEMSKEEAIKIGAQMEFGHKYPDRVSVYFVGNYSKEFCGGPHVKNTKELGTFRIVKEESSSAGVRRIKAILEEQPYLDGFNK